MNKFRIYYLPFIFFLLLGCNEKRDLLNDFAFSQNLEHKILYIDNNNELYNPMELLSNDSLLILHNAMSPSHFTLVSMNEGRVLKHFGVQGSGPCEFIGCLQINKFSLGNKINTPDNLQARMYQYDMNSLLESENPQPIDLFSSVVNKSAKEIYNRILQINDSVFIGMPGYPKGRFTVFNINNNTSYAQGEYPQNTKHQEISDQFKQSGYQGFLSYNEHNKKVVFASISSEMIEIYTLDGTEMILDTGLYTTLPDFSLVENNGGIGVKMTVAGGHYIALSSSDDYIYVLYSKKDEKASVHEKFQGNHILVFDWAGNPIRKYVLDSEVKTIDVSSDGKRIYAIWDNPDPEIIYFELQSGMSCPHGDNSKCSKYKKENEKENFWRNRLVSNRSHGCVECEFKFTKR